ncbi:MAG: hybrid sensor histidine kinase/response regulator [Deltaproteobacteria bacterium]|nr:hybrid sensor histidine kinase/response regulator [Deltaproteobacteria bacterium]
MKSRQVAISSLTVEVPVKPVVAVVAKDLEWADDLSRALEPRGFMIRLLPGLGSVAPMVETDAPDLIVLQVGGAWGEAHEVCRSLKEQSHARGVPLLAFSSEDTADSRVEAARAGFDHWMAMPGEVEVLVQRVHALVKTGAVIKALSIRSEQLLLWRDWVRYLVHDLRNPLSIALGNLAFVQQDVVRSGEEETHKALEEARYELGRVSAMLQDLLDTDRLQRGVLVPQKQVIDLAVVARNVAASARVLAEAKKTSVVVDATGNGQVSADPSLAQRVCANLVGNAVRYARKRAIFIEVEGRPDSVTVRVGNDGPGIARELQSRLFEPWVRLDPGAAMTHGTGLGLAFCRLVLEAHGGRIWIDSAEDGNVVFAFRLLRA